MISVVYLSTVSAICGGMGLFILWKRITLFLKANRAIGYFVRWEQRGLKRMHYYPVVRFHAMDGNEYEFVGEPGTSTKNEKEQYSVLYPADRPQAAMIHSFMAYWLALIVFFILSAGMAAAAIKQ